MSTIQATCNEIYRIVGMKRTIKLSELESLLPSEMCIFNIRALVNQMIERQQVLQLPIADSHDMLISVRDSPIVSDMP